MAVATRICKICGSEYEYCRTERNVPNLNRWQDVACCVDHASEYFARVEAARAASSPTLHIENSNVEQEVVISNVDMEIDIEDDGEFEYSDEEYDDEDEYDEE